MRVTYIISDIDKALAFEWIVQYIDRTRFELDFVLLNNGSAHLEHFLRDNDIEVKLIHVGTKKDWPLALWQLYKYLRKRKPDVVHCHLFAANILGLSAARLAGVPQRIYTRHHSDYHFRYFPKGVKWDKYCNSLATKIIAPSGAVKNVLLNMESVPNDKVKLIHHGFDLRYFHQVPADLRSAMKQKYNPDNRFPIVGVISRFTELKGIQYIIPAFQQLLLTYPNALLLLFNARGDYEQQINQMLQSLPPGSYCTVPFEQELAVVYSLFDLFIQASVDTNIEAFGQTYVEALAAGVPSVFTLAGIAADFIKDGENALVVTFNDASSIHFAMLRLLKDESLRVRLAKQGKADVANLFTITNMVNALEDVYTNG